MFFSNILRVLLPRKSYVYVGLCEDFLLQELWAEFIIHN